MQRTLYPPDDPLNQSDVNVTQLLFFLLTAKALIPDDSDEELIEKAKLNKAARLQKDKQLEKVSAASTGNVRPIIGSYRYPSSHLLLLVYSSIRGMEVALDDIVDIRHESEFNPSSVPILSPHSSIHLSS